MKRSRLCSDFDGAGRFIASLKRRKLPPFSSNGCCLPSAVSRSPLALPLTPETLQALSSQSAVPQASETSIEQWASNCDSCTEPPIPQPQTPSAMSSEGGSRRASKLGFRRQRSLSPTKKTSTQYRSRNMADASVFVDHFPEPPSDVEDQLKDLFGVPTLDDIGQSFPSHVVASALVEDENGRASSSLSVASAPIARDMLEELATKYCHKSRQMAKDCAGEGQWKSYLLTGLVEPLQELWPHILKLSASEKPWISDLRPSPPTFDEMLGSECPLPIPSESRTIPAEPLTPLRPPRGLALLQTPTLSASSNAASDVAEESNRVSIPKPDIALGFAHASFARLQGRILWELQDNNRVFSEPHQSGIGLHFPFLVMEAKGLAAGSNMVGAQNQAAVDGACVLNSLRGLELAAVLGQPGPKQFLFSVVTEGPIHELWVHYQVEDAYHMTLLRIWRTTSRKEAGEFVMALSKIFTWGVYDFRAEILKKLTAIEKMLREHRCD